MQRSFSCWYLKGKEGSSRKERHFIRLSGKSIVFFYLECLPFIFWFLLNSFTHEGKNPQTEDGGIVCSEMWSLRLLINEKGELSARNSSAVLEQLLLRAQWNRKLWDGTGLICSIRFILIKAQSTWISFDLWLACNLETIQTNETACE